MEIVVCHLCVDVEQTLVMLILRVRSNFPVRLLQDFMEVMLSPATYTHTYTLIHIAVFSRYGSYNCLWFDVFQCYSPDAGISLSDLLHYYRVKQKQFTMRQKQRQSDGVKKVMRFGPNLSLNKASIREVTIYAYICSCYILDQVKSGNSNVILLL